MYPTTDSESKARATLEATVSKTVAAFEQSLTEVANQPTVGQYFVREHVRQSIPAILEARNSLKSTAATAQGGSFAAQGGLEFAAILGAALSQPTLDQIHHLLSQSQETGKAIVRNRKHAQHAQQRWSPPAVVHRMLSRGREQ